MTHIVEQVQQLSYSQPDLANIFTDADERSEERDESLALMQAANNFDLKPFIWSQINFNFIDFEIQNLEVFNNLIC